MGYQVQTRWGSSESDPPESRLRQILDELSTADPEHPETWLTHESGWTLSVDERGELLLLSPDESAQHMLGSTRDQALAYWLMLAAGKIDDLRALPWKFGYPPRDPAEL